MWCVNTNPEVLKEKLPESWFVGYVKKAQAFLHEQLLVLCSVKLLPRYYHFNCTPITRDERCSALLQQSCCWPLGPKKELAVVVHKGNSVDETEERTVGNNGSSWRPTALESVWDYGPTSLFRLCEHSRHIYRYIYTWLTWRDF